MNSDEKHRPGKDHSPMGDNAATAGDNHAGHSDEDHHAMMIKDFRRRFWISVLITIPVLALSPMIQNLAGFEIAFPHSSMVLFALAAIVYFYGGWPFLKGFVKEIRQGRPGMMVLIAVAITVAFGYSAATTFFIQGTTFFWELATLIDIMLLGHWIEMKSIAGASNSLQKLVELLPKTAHRRKDGSTQDVEVAQIQNDDIVIVHPGEKIPVDGVIVDGQGVIDESMITGESQPVSKASDDSVTGGTINGNSPLTIRVTQTGAEGYLNKVIAMVKQAQQEKSKSQHLADRIAFWLTVVALGTGFGTLATWLFLGKPFVFALERMATVMVIACPHALGLAVPLVVAISTSMAAQHGLLIRNRTAFEDSRRITVLLFDKTGTLTKGNFGVTRLGALDNNHDENSILRLAGAIESKSEHPLATAIMQRVKEQNIEIPTTEDIQAITGMGIEGNVDGNMVRVVGPRYLEDKGMDIPSEAQSDAAETVVFVVRDEKVIGFIAMADEIREESYDAVKILKDNGLKVMMATGDNEQVARAVSEKLGLDRYFAGMLPDGKLKKIRELQNDGEFVCMTGDGINDAPALAAANVGIAVGSGTDVAADTADIILVNSNPRDIVSLILFGKKTYAKMIQNFVWATAYNVVAIPLAAGVLYQAGIVISPAVGAVFMSISTIIVAINAQLLKKALD